MDVFANWQHHPVARRRKLHTKWEKNVQSPAKAKMVWRRGTGIDSQKKLSDNDGKSDMEQVKLNGDYIEEEDCKMTMEERMQ
jgi:hypothetical protein